MVSGPMAIDALLSAVQRWMSKAGLGKTGNTGLLRRSPGRLEVRCLVVLRLVVLLPLFLRERCVIMLRASLMSGGFVVP